MVHEKIPAETKRVAIIHNDYKLDNLVLSPKDPLKIIGILDWEMATIGDPPDGPWQFPGLLGATGRFSKRTGSTDAANKYAGDAYQK